MKRIDFNEYWKLHEDPLGSSTTSRELTRLNPYLDEKILLF